MKLANRLAAFGLCILAGVASLAEAEDTDLFVNDPALPDRRPNVLIILDNTANWSASADGGTKFDLEKAALQSVFDQLPDDRFNIGLMLFSETGGDNGNPSGGYPRYAIREMNSENRAALSSRIAGLGRNADKGNSAEYALAMDEAYLYFSGLDARAGHNKVKRDEDAFDVNPRYRGTTEDTCAKKYIIFISNGAPDNGENTKAAAALAALGGKLNSDPIPLNPSGRQANWSDEYARFMARHDIKTYTIDVNPLTTGQGPDNTALLQSVAGQGQGRYYAVYTDLELELAIQSALDEMQAVNSVYASTALPVSVNVRGTHLNEVYMAVFRPDANARPRWLGNLKLYQLAVDASTNDLYLADSRGQPAQSPVTGFVRSDAISFWTHTSTYWSFSPRGTPESASDSPDGEVVEKGGSAQVQRDDWTAAAATGGWRRWLYTCTDGCTAGQVLSAADSDSWFWTSNGDISTSALGAANDSERDALIYWTRGHDNTSPAERSAGAVRPSIQGDVVHSRPAVVNYNRTGDDTDVVVFFGSNDGTLRAVKGGKTAGGHELWAFVAPEHLGKLKRLRDNSPNIHVPSDPDDPDGNKPYFVDGNIGVYVHDLNGDGRIIADADDDEVDDRAWIFVPMRRGGRFLYAFDVSNPEAPRFKWRRTHADTGYGELGQTWSEPKAALINLNGNRTPVLIMGAGYDPARDDRFPDDATVTRTMGRGVFVINAAGGDVIWQAGPSPSGAAHNLTVAGMQYSIPADVTVIDRDRNGFADRVYAADTGGNVWRLDIGSTDPGNWAVYRLASLGGTGANARKFLYPPDVVYGEGYDAVLIGSGDREHPLTAAHDETVIDHFYMLKDRNTGPSGAGQTTLTLSDLYDATGNLAQVGTASQAAAARVSLSDSYGWYVRLTGSGEKTVGSAITIAGSVFFGTNEPTPPDTDLCLPNLGTARIYVLSFTDASATGEFDGIEGLTTTDRNMTVPGGGLLPSPTPVIVKIGEGNAPVHQAVCFGPTCVPPPTDTFDRRNRVFWFRCIEGDGGNSATAACAND